MGADVIKIERPGRGDDARAWAPPWWGDQSATFLAFNRNKRSLALDLKTAAGRAVLKRLVARVDVFVQSLSAEATRDLGVDFVGASAMNSRLVYCAITAFGTSGPLRDMPGYDPMMQAYAGLMSVNGHPGQEPVRVGTSIVDMGTGMWAALGIVAALRERDRTGRAVEVTTSLFETTLMWVSYHAMGYLASGETPVPQGSGTAMIAPYQAFPAADGYVMIAARSPLRRLAHPGGRRAAGVTRGPAAARRPRRVRADLPRLPPRRRTVAPQRSHSGTYPLLLVERSADRHVVTVILNRPEQMNAMNTAMGEDLLACFDGLKMDTDARAVVFTGAGDRAFCAGGDLKERNEMSDETWRAPHVIFEQGASRVLKTPGPGIAALESFAPPGGREPAALADLIVASERAGVRGPE